MVFSDRKFIVVQNKTDNPERYEALVGLIRAHGGEIVAWDERADGDVSPKLIIVSSTVDYERAEEMKRFMIPTVTEKWVHACIQENKLVPLRPYSPDPRNFMKEVIVCFSGLSAGDTDVFKAGVLASGGECTDIVTRYTTHVVATTTETPECQLVLQSQKNNPDVKIKLVRPEWIDACMSLKVKVDDTPYLLTGDNSSQIHVLPSQDLTGTFPIKDSPRLAVQQSMREGLGSNILDGRKFYLGSDLDLSERVGKTVTYLIETNGGVITSDLKDAQAYIGKWREGDEYVQASKQRIVIGNITWLYWVMIHQKYEKPNHLLHYPEVKGGLPSMRDFKICVTNYTGDARAYLQSLIVSLGATYSGKLIENHSTHLITAYESGQKYEAAKRWGIPIVNHLWLEDSYAYWQVQDPTSRLYTYFAPKLSMSTLIGTRNLVANVLTKFQKPEELRLTREQHAKRQAKQRAGNWLHDAMIIENEFHKQMKRGKLPPVEPITDIRKSSSRSSSAGAPEIPREDTTTTGSAEPEGSANSDSANTSTNTSRRSSPSVGTEPVHTKKQKKTTSTQQKLTNSNPIRVMFTGVDSPPSNKACSQHGVSVVKTTPVDILIAPRFMKTVKFLQCLASAQDFVTPAWIEKSIQSGALLPVDKYRIKDEQLSRALRAREALENHKVFEGLAFRLDPSLKDKSTAFRDLVKAHGGQVLSTRAHSPGDSVIIVGSEDDQVPFDKFIESIQHMDRSILPLE